MLDRWRWLRRRLALFRPGGRILDAGCGSGAFAIGLAALGFDVVGLTWSEQEVAKAKRRAVLAGVGRSTRFEVADVRQLGDRSNLRETFDGVVCFETIEHVLDDAALVQSLAGCLRDGGHLLLTSPNAAYRPITRGDDGPFSVVEDGGHVRKGYFASDFEHLARTAGLEVVEISSCGGYVSQKVTKCFRVLATRSHTVARVGVLPLRLLPLLLDPAAGRALSYPDFSLAMVCRKRMREPSLG